MRSSADGYERGGEHSDADEGAATDTGHGEPTVWPLSARLPLGLTLGTAGAACGPRARLPRASYPPR